MTDELKKDLHNLLFEIHCCITDIAGDGRDEPSMDMLHLINYIVAIGALINEGFDCSVYPYDDINWEERLLFNNNYNHNFLLNNKEIFDRHGIAIPEELKE